MTAGLAARIRAGDVGALARACRMVDERAAGHRELLGELFPPPLARTIGITGAPGVGKSTLTDALIGALRAQGERVGVLAVDPSSPFSGGALLGDRIRMQRHALDAEVFIRSLASRGAHGGLSRSVADTLALLEAWGAQTVIVETVGVGQAEFELLGVVESVVVVVMPGSGDDIQANKAGLLEVADLVVLNKADRPGADATEAELRVALALSATPGHSEQRALVRTVAPRGEGISELMGKLDEHRAWLIGTPEGRARHTERVRRSLLALFRDVAAEAIVASASALIEELVGLVLARELDPYQASERLLAQLFSKPQGG